MKPHSLLLAPLPLLLIACGPAELPDSDEADDLDAEAAAVTCPPGGSLRVGQSFVVTADRFTGDEETTQPKTDANDGRNGDNPYFQRHNVARAHLDYWYTSSHQEAGEPDPRGEQWVDYRPPLSTLGAGRYEITAQYRQTDNRASYPAQYTVRYPGGRATRTADQRQGSGYVSVPLGTFNLGCTGWVRVRDTGAASITFNRMTFRFLGP